MMLNNAASAITALRNELHGRTQNFDDACATIARLEQTNSVALDKAEQERDKALAELDALRQERDAARAEVEELRALLLDIKTDPHGCRFCDDGVLRTPNNPDKDHDPGCVWPRIDAALREGEK
jgi:hypothetical protein